MEEAIAKGKTIKITQTMRTRILNLKASCLVGQCAFRSSATTPAKKLNLDFLAGADLVLSFLERAVMSYFVSL